MSTELERRSIGAVARSEFDPEQTRLIAATVAKDASPAELAMFLELCRRYELDPFAGQIYFTKMPGKNGQAGRPAIIVGRDGFLTIANRHDDYEGFDSDVVREKDVFRVERDENGHPKVSHTYEGGAEARGPIIGAWAVVHRVGRRPRYFFANYEEYVPKSEAKLAYSPWSTQPSVMIEKCAISTALRLAFNISGLIGEEEASNVLLRDQSPEGNFEFSSDPDLAARLTALFMVLAELRPSEFRPAKVRLMMRDKSEEEKVAFVPELEAMIVAAGGVVPPEAIDGEEVVDAEVVPDPPPGEDDGLDVGMSAGAV